MMLYQIPDTRFENFLLEEHWPSNHCYVISPPDLLSPPPLFLGTLPHDIYPLTFEDLTPGELLFTVAVWNDNHMHIEHERPFVVYSEAREVFLGEYYLGRTVEIARQFPHQCLGEVFLNSYGFEEPSNQWRTFRWSPRVEAYLRDLVARQAFAEYLALIARPRRRSSQTSGDVTAA